MGEFASMENMEANNNSRFTCKGLLRESLSGKGSIPSLVTICINKLRTMRNSIMDLGEKNIPSNLVHLIYKGSTCYELLTAERNNSGIQSMFGSDDGQIWDSLWETAVKVRYSNNEQTLSKKQNEETYREFFIRNQEDTEKKFKSNVLKRSKSFNVAKVKRTLGAESSKMLNRRTLSLHSASCSGKGSSKRSINILENDTTPMFGSSNPLSRQKSFKISSLSSTRSNKSNNPILREYFEQKSRDNSIHKLAPSVNPRIIPVSSTAMNAASVSAKLSKRPDVTFKLN